METDRIKKIVDNMFKKSHEELINEIKNEVDKRFYTYYINEKINETKVQCYNRIDREINDLFKKFNKALDSTIDDLAQQRLQELKKELIDTLEN